MVSRPIEEASAGTAIRIVIENPALGSLVVATQVPPSALNGSSAFLLAHPGPPAPAPVLAASQVGIYQVQWALTHVRIARYVHRTDRRDRLRDQETYVPIPDDELDTTTGEYELSERQALRRVPGLSTELTDVTEVEYRQLRLERVVLVGVWTEGTQVDAENSLTELAALAETAGSQVLEGLIQRRNRPDPATYIGRGKVDDLGSMVLAAGADTVICDGELSPSQLRNLEQRTKVKVVDRTALILDIFAQHAKSKEGRAQVELAQLEYLLPGCAAGARRCPGRQVGRAVAAVPAVASACVVPVRQSWRPTGGASATASPGSAGRSRPCGRYARPSAPAAPATRCPRWRSPVTRTPASPAC
ncbi:hypothetical protein GCM10029963_27930 [Micromonospora andamanensis]